jgi:hypothetical protein
VSIALSSVAAFAGALTAARSVDFAAYTLPAGGVRDALAAAARAGARVRVRLEDAPFDDPAGMLHAANAEAVAALTAAGADAALTAPGGPVLHMKAAVVDGVAWLDDRNWADAGAQTIVRDSDADDARAVGRALAGEPGGDAHLGTTKAAAQRLELAVVAAAGGAPLALESESFGSGAVYNALLARARAGEPTRLLVAGREADQAGPAGDTERRRLAKLAALGAAVRTGNPAGLDFDEKLAVADGAAWAGSANATYARGAAGAQRDWGMLTRVPTLIDGLRRTFEANWQAAQPLATPTGSAERGPSAAVTAPNRSPSPVGRAAVTQGPLGSG